MNLVLKTIATSGISTSIVGNERGVYKTEATAEEELGVLVGKVSASI